MKWFISFLSFIFLTNCKKDKLINYKFVGQILESSSNPKFVSNYELHIRQSAEYGIIGGVSGIDEFIKTDAYGRFVFSYNADENYGLLRGGRNPNDISIEGVDRTQYNNLWPHWYNLSPRTDTNLHVLYLYKKIDALVIKVRFTKPLNQLDTLFLVPKNKNKYLVGPIASGAHLAIDTFVNHKLSYYNIRNKTYRFDLSLEKSREKIRHDFTFEQGDESYKEITVNY